MIVYNNSAPKAVNNVGQFGATEGSIGAYKSAAEYAADAKYWALLSQTKYSSVEDLLAEVERLYAQSLLMKSDIEQLKNDFEEQNQALLGLIQSTGTAIDNTNAATELSKEATQEVLAQLDIISNMTVQTTLLPPGSLATGSYDNTTGVFSFGIPEGQPGRDGTDGTISDIGNVSIGTPVSDDYGFYVDKEDGGLYRTSMADIANLVPSIKSISINGGEEQTGAVSFNSVSSFNTRTGDILPMSGDYSVSQITGAAASGINSDITSLEGLTTALSVAQGGTGANTPEGARTNLELGSVSVENIVPVLKGGTGASTAEGARTNLGLGLVSTESIVPITKGGTGSTSSENARLALVSAKSGDNYDITSLNNLTTALSVTQGGTGASTPDEAWLNIRPTGSTLLNADPVNPLDAATKRWTENYVKPTSRELFRRSLIEAGITLVEGSFEEGATVNNASSAVWSIAEGDCYTWGGSFNKIIPANSTPASTGGVAPDAWISVHDLLLRTQITSGDGANLIGSMSYADIRAYNGSAVRIYCYGISNIFDNSAGFFYKDSLDSSSADNNATVLVDALGRRWKRQYSGDIDIRWFGCKGDGVTDNYTSLNNAIQWACTSGRKVTFYVPQGVFLINSTITTPGRYGFNMRGEGGLRDNSASIIKFAAGHSLNIRGSNSTGTQGPTYMQMYIDSIVFSGSLQSSDSPVKLIDMVGVIFDKCTFAMCLYGINMLNEFYWTESCVARNCYFPVTCSCAILYRVRTDNQYVSFYGSGLDNCFLENSGNGIPKVQIASRAQPYNAPMNITLGHKPAGGHAIISHNGDVKSWFVGNIRAEVGEEGLCPLVSGNPLYIVGDFTCMGGKVTTDLAYFCYDVRQNVTSNVISYRRKPFTRQVKFSAAGGGQVFAYTPNGAPQTFRILLTIAAPSYSYEMEVLMHTNYANGTEGNVRTVTTFRTYDPNSIGVPSIEYNASGSQAQLFVWRNGLPAGAVVHMDITQLSTSLDYPLL